MTIPTLLLVAALASTPSDPRDAPAPAQAGAGQPGAGQPGAAQATTERPRILVLALQAQDVDAAEAAVIDDLVVEQLTRRGAEVLSQKDLARLSALEADRETLGCDEVSCLAELAGAMGSRYVVFGTLGRLDGDVVVALDLFDSHGGRAVARQTLRAGSTGRLAGRKLTAAVDRLVAPIGLPPAPASVAPLFVAGAATLGVGSVAAVVFGAAAGLAEATLWDPGAAAANKEVALAAGPAVVVAAGLGAAVAAAGGALLLLDGTGE